MYFSLACDEPPELENAEIDVGTVTVGSIRHYTCSDGLGMYGSGSATCQADSTWSTLDSQCFGETIRMLDYLLLSSLKGVMDSRQT